MFLIKFLVKLSLKAKQFQTKQRRKTFAKRGEETGLKALSQPTGTRARDCSGVTGGRNSCCQAVGFTVGRRSPLSARFTEAAGVELNPAPVVDNEGKETRLAVTNANATAATRNDHMLRIGVSPKSRQPPEIPTTPMPRIREFVWPRAIKNVATRARFRNAPKNSPCRDTAHTCVMMPAPPAGWRNKPSGRALSCGPAILSPSPRVGPVTLGAADGPISCALIFCVGTFIPGRRQRVRPEVAGPMTGKAANPDSRAAGQRKWIPGSRAEARAPE